MLDDGYSQGDNESLSRFMENAKNTTKIMERQVDEGPAGEEQGAVVFN